MGKPSFRNRFTLAGQDEHESRPGGDATVPGDTSVSCYYDTSDSGANGGGTYDTGTRFVGFGEDITSAIKNRVSWAMSQNADHMYERLSARPDFLDRTAAGGGDTGIQITYSAGPPHRSAVVFLGEEGDSATEARQRMYIYDSDTLFETIDAAGDKVVAGDVVVTIPAFFGGGTQTCYPVGNLPAPTTGTLPKITVVATANNYEVQTSAALTGAALGVGVFNYSHWQRQAKAYRGGATIQGLEEAFATIVDFTSTSNFGVHRDVSAGGLNWQVDDELTISHFAWEPTLSFEKEGGGAATIAAGELYRIYYLTHDVLGINTDAALSRLFELAACGVPNEVTAILGSGLDAAYDRLGFPGAAGGSGRVIELDSGPVHADIQTSGDIGFEAGTDSSSSQGTIGFAAFTRNVAAGQDTETTGVATAVRMSATNANGTDWSPADPATGAAAVLTLGGVKTFAAGGGTDHEIYEGLDLVYLEDGSGDPVATAGSPNGFYIIDQVTANQTANLVSMNGSAANLTGAGVATATWFRPTFVGMSGNLGFHPGAPASPHKTNVFTNRGTDPAVDFAAEFNAIVYHTGAAGTVTDFTHHYVGNKDRVYPIMTDSFRENSTFATHYFPERRLGCIGTTVNDVDVVIEYLDKTDADDMYLRWEWTEASALGGSGNSMLRWDADKAATLTNGLLLLPWGDGVGLDDGGTYSISRFSCGETGNNDHVELLGSYHSGSKLQGGLLAYFEGGTQHNTHALLKEAPATPVAPIVTATDATIEHRFEVHEDTNIGWSDYRTLYKVVNLALGQEAGASASAWVAYTLASTLIWDNRSDTDNDFVYFPLLVPHGSEILEVKCRYYSDQVLGAAAANLDVNRVDSSAMTGAAGAGVTVAPLRAAGSVTMNPGAGNTVDYTYACHQNNVVDLETYDYSAVVECGSNGGGSIQKILQIMVEFKWVDIFPE